MTTATTATTVTTDDNAEPSATWVERQHERLEEASDTNPAHLQVEDGVGAVFGGSLGLVGGLVVAGLLLVPAVPVAVGSAVLVLLAGGVLGALAGSLIGGVMIGRRAHEAEAEFADLRAHARQEPPVAPAAGPAPMPVEPGETVFADEPHS